MKKKFILIIFILSIFIGGCDYLEISAPAHNSRVEANFSNLPQLPDSLSYALYLRTDGSTNFVKLLNSASGSYNLVQEIPGSQINSSKEFILSIVKTATPDSILMLNNKGIILLEGKLNSNDAQLTQNSVKEAEGKYLLATPTDGNSSVDEKSGVWFMDSLAIGGKKGLLIPDLASAWTYEAWVEVSGQILSLGKFASASSKVNAAPYSNNIAPGYNFPGGDLLVNAPAGLTFPVNLENAKVAISLEPLVDFDQGSPYLIFLEATIPSGVAAGQSMNLERLNNLPICNLKIVIE